MIKISLVQCNSVLGSIESNKQKILFEVKKSVKNGSDILIFPEMFFPQITFSLFSSGTSFYGVFVVVRATYSCPSARASRTSRPAEPTSPSSSAKCTIVVMECPFFEKNVAGFVAKTMKLNSRSCKK